MPVDSYAWQELRKKKKLKKKKWKLTRGSFYVPCIRVVLSTWRKTVNMKVAQLRHIKNNMEQ